MLLYSPASLFLVVPFFFFSLVYCLDHSNTVALSSLSYPDTTLHPYQLRYIRVDLPQWFSSLSITVESDVDLNLANVEKVPKSMLPMICFRDGSPPLPDVTNTSVHGLVLAGLSNQSIGRIEGTQDIEQCYPMQKNITVKLTNEQKINFWIYPIEHPDCCFVTLLNSPLPIQISPGVWYFGLFNGIGPIRTQSKMIIRGDSYSFSANITVDGCIASTVWGNYCNQTFSPLTCSQPVNYNHTIGSLLSCKNSLPSSCTANGEVKVYTFDILGVTEEVNINIKFNATSSNITDDGSLMFFVRNGAIASDVLYDYSSNVSNLPLVIRHPKVGHWFVTVSYRNSSKQSETTQTPSAAAICYSLEVQVVECPTGQAGPNCLWKRYDLKTILRQAVTFESYYLPIGGNMSSTSPNFPLEPLLSNSSVEGNETWTYFVLDVPRGAAGGNIHIHLTSDSEIINYETYMRYGGMPSLSVWDYYYANKTSSSYDSSTFFMLNNSTEDKIDFYILYAREGTWTFGLRNLNITATEPTTMSISFERCPRKCSSHGECKSSLDFSGLTSYSYCSCDRTHGGFDCSIELVSPRGHVVQSIFLIASNVAAILPAFWALRQKAFAEWVLFTASGISSGLYHACDVGTWCALSFSVLQFMDFWLSFMAVVSTFVFLTTIDEVHKRTIHTVVAILTALMAITKATRSSNIILVMAIGALGLLIGWLIELTTKFRTISLPVGFCLNLLEPDRWHIIKRTMRNLVKKLVRRFHWWFMIPGFALLIMAGISWKLETSESYWIWHSVWHVTIYTSSFFFLCSKANPVVDGNNQRVPSTSYELTRQDSSSRVE